MSNHFIAKKISFIGLLLAALSLTGCHQFFDKDNTPPPNPLKNFTATVKPQLRWSTHVGPGSNGEYVKMTPAVSETTIFASNTNGLITAVNKINGQVLWRNQTKLALLSGPGIGNGIVVAGSRRGDVIALEQSTGRVRWKQTVTGAILATPAVAHDIVLIKTIDGLVKAFSAIDGRERWSYKHVEPSLVLRGASTPIIYHQDALVGFENGTLAKFSLKEGRLFWEQPLATPEGAFNIDRMIDIDANPLVFNQQIYAATYQGKIASLDWTSGKINWSQDISSYTGMAVDNQHIYISDAKSLIWAFRTDTGDNSWELKELAYRNVTAPALMGNYLALGDGQGYLHWLNKQDGKVSGRISVGNAIYATPIAENNVLYVLTNKGQLNAYVLNS